MSQMIRPMHGMEFLLAFEFPRGRSHIAEITRGREIRAADVSLGCARLIPMPPGVSAP